MKADKLTLALFALTLFSACEESSSGADHEAVLPTGQGATSVNSGATSGTSDVGGTGQGGEGVAGGPLTLPEVVALWAQADCETLYSCGPTFHDSLFADATACLLAAATRYAWMMTLPGTGFTIERALACAEARASQACDDYFSYVNPPECDPPGALEPGEPCVVGLQCSSTFCAGKGGCGACAEAPAAGAPCTSSANCSAGMQCSAAMKCAPPAKLGARCGPEQPCDNWLICNGTCQRYPATVGATCGAAGCDFRAGMTCNQSTGECAAVTLDAKSCGWVDATQVVSCSAQRTCTMQGSCVAPPGLGQACSALTRCQIPLVCNDGKCAALPTLDSCEP